ncbi:MAG: hypothetical protein JWQ11_222 [Rhizobacter sp.]|nr:hypothetical protein [Rhizobacter sp.]
MGLLSFLQRKPDAAPARTGKAAPVKAPKAADAGDAVQRARTLARQRLIGAAMLVLIGIVGFPLLFETQPRPIALDVPIDIPGKDTAAPLAVPPRRADSSATSPVASAPSVPANTSVASKGAAPVITESSADAGRDVTPSAASPAARADTTRGELSPSDFAAAEKAGAERLAAEKAAQERATSKAATDKAASDRTASAAKAEAVRNAAQAAARDKARSAPGNSDSSRALALLEGKDAPSKAAAPATEAPGRFIVQVGAFSEDNAARDARSKVEKLGLKTYTQVVETAAGKRIRVRVGPFASKGEADSAAGKIRSAGLQSAIISL